MSVISRAAAYEALVCEMREAGLPKIADISQDEWERWLDAAIADPEVMRREFERLLKLYQP